MRKGIKMKHKNENGRDNENQKEINNNNKNENEDRIRMIILTSSRGDIRERQSTQCIIYYHITIYHVIIFYHQSYAPDSRG